MAFYENEEDAFLPLRDVVFKQLREEILYGKLKPGERLMEVALSERLGVSRTPIREGIRLLEKEGLVVMLPRRGAHVASITAKQLTYLPPQTVIGRLTGDAPLSELIAPGWTRKKVVVLNEIDKYMANNDLWQGKEFK